MLTFIILAAALAVIGVVVVTWPLLKRAGAGTPSPWAALAAGMTIVVGSAALYATWSKWSWRSTPAADSPQSMVARLARQLERDPQNLDGWLTLGRSYTVLQEYPLAIRAYERADRLSGGRSAEALTGEAEALALGDESELDGRAARLIEQALRLAPDSPKALFYGGAVAERRGDLTLARQRFAALLAQNPPAAVRPLLEQQIRVIDEKLAAGPAATAPSTPAVGTSSAAAVHVNVTVAPGLTATASGAPLFVFVRGPGGGPPLAVKRLDSRFPQNVVLTQADAMVPGRAFASGQSVTVVARVARSGSPVGASGDPFGEVAYQVGRDQVANLDIDRLTP